MKNARLSTPGRVAGAFLVLGSIVTFPGLIMFWLREGYKGGAPPTHTYYLLERLLIAAGIIPTAIGFMLLQPRFHSPTARRLAFAGATGYPIAGLFGIVAEAGGLGGPGTYLYPLLVVYVVVAFLSQAVVGAALFQSRLLARWIGATTMLWNLAWPLLLVLLSPRDVYFPVLHHVMPLVIGIALLRHKGKL